VLFKLPFAWKEKYRKKKTKTKIKKINQRIPLNDTRYAITRTRTVDCVLKISKISG
jgi:hypothetical protein